MGLLLAVLALSCLFGLASCGGGDSGSTTASVGLTPTPDFTMAVSPSTIGLWQGAPTSVTVSITPVLGFNASVSISVTGLPSGVSVSPSPATATVNTPATITLSTSSATPAGPVTLSFTGSSGSLSHTVQAAAQVAALAQGAHAPFRTQYTFADLVFQPFSQPTIFYHQPTRRFFYPDSPQNRILVFDAATELQIESISVPNAWAIDQTPDGSTLYVGTMSGDIYTLDPVGMTVTGHIPWQQIGPGYDAWKVMPLADGRFALLGYYTDSGGGYYYQSFAIWNSATNAFAAYSNASQIQTNLYSPPPPHVTQVCQPMGQIRDMVMTPDRTTLLFGSEDTDFTVCKFDPSTAQYQTITAPNGTNILVPPDGQEFITWQGATPIYIYDMSTMQVTDHFALVELTGATGNFMLSRDGSTIYEFGNGNGVAYNWRTHAQLGWFPVPQVDGGHYPWFSALDETGLLAGALQQGIGFADASVLNSSAIPIEEDDRNIYGQVDGGPVSGGTLLDLSAIMPANITNVYFGSEQISGVSNDGPTLTTPITSPAHAAGPVDVTVKSSDGSLVSNFLGFSYGPYLTQSVANYSTAEGGVESVVGYGIWTNPDGGDIDMSLIQATSNGHNDVPVAGGLIYSNLQYVEVNLPPGTAGSSADVTVTNSAGTSMLPNAVTYLPATRQFALPGASLEQGVYDPSRDLYYFTDVRQIRVFSRTQGKWLPSISIPPAAGAATQTLFALAISPDSSKLAITDTRANAVYLVNLNNTAQVSTFSAPTNTANVAVGPLAVVVTNEGIIYYAADNPTTSTFFRLDTSTGISTPISGLSITLPGSDPLQRLLLSADEQRIYYAIPGSPISGMPAMAAIYEPATNTVYEREFLDYAGDDELALSANQFILAISEAIFDNVLDLHAYLSDPPGTQAIDETFVPGEKLSADGSLLFEPLQDGILVNDTASGRPFARVTLPLTIAPYYDSLVGDGKDNVLVAITGTGNGIAVIDLSSLVAPATQDSPFLTASREPSPGMRALPLAASGWSKMPPARVVPSPRRFASARKSTAAVSPAAAVASTPAAPLIVSPAAAAQADDLAATSSAGPSSVNPSASPVTANRQTRQANMPALLSLALSTLPANTVSLEYDDLAALRQAAQYGTLRQAYSSMSVQRAQTALASLGISEQSIRQVALASNGISFYGLISGSLNGAAALQAAPKNARTPLGDEAALCTATQFCIAFIEDSIAAFGTLDQLTAIQQVRSRRALALSSNRPLANLLAQADFSAPVIGVAPGLELHAWMNGSAAKTLLNRSSVAAALAMVASFEYSVVLDSRAHVQMTLNMSSVLTANAVAAVLNGLSATLSAGAKVSSSMAALPITGLHATAIGSQVSVRLGAAIS
ncbi:MAG TPA: hypothetical protein VHU83_21305 [Bryobacteraceae bacterium]|nr:hypothetical protein [Bryobacteraceae bacterium]